MSGLTVRPSAAACPEALSSGAVGTAAHAQCCQRPSVKPCHVPRVACSGVASSLFLRQHALCTELSVDGVGLFDMTVISEGRGHAVMAVPHGHGKHHHHHDRHHRRGGPEDEQTGGSFFHGLPFMHAFGCACSSFSRAVMHVKRPECLNTQVAGHQYHCSQRVLWPQIGWLHAVFPQQVLPAGSIALLTAGSIVATQQGPVHSRDGALRAVEPFAVQRGRRA